jgi:hypothetical protein
MKPQQREMLRAVMNTAWFLYRSAAARGEPMESFSDALKAGWAWEKHNRAFAKRMRGASHIRFSPDLIRSPIGRAAGRNRSGDFGAAYLTARLGR